MRRAALRVSQLNSTPSATLSAPPARSSPIGDPSAVLTATRRRQALGRLTSTKVSPPTLTRLAPRRKNPPTRAGWAWCRPVTSMGAVKPRGEVDSAAVGVAIVSNRGRHRAVPQIALELFEALSR